MTVEPDEMPRGAGGRAAGGFLADRQDRRMLFAVVTLWLGAMALAMPWGNFPINDDWVYGLAVQSLLEQGRYQFPSPSSANVGPQIWWGALFCLPFGFSYDALRASTIVLAVVALVAMYLLVRQCGGSRSGAALSASALGFHPMFFGLAASFMTDVPFVSLSLVSCCLLVRSLTDDSRRVLVAGLAFALLAVLSRQLGIALLLGWAVAWVYRHGLNLRTASAGVLAVGSGLAAHLAYQYWLVRTGRTPVIGHHSDPVNLLRQIDSFAWTLRYTGGLMVANIGFLTLPVALWFVGTSRATAASATAVWRTRLTPLLSMGLALMVVVLALTTFGEPPIPTGNVLMRWSFGPLLLRDIEILRINTPSLPEPILALWWLVNGAAILASALLLTRLVPAIGRLLAWWWPGTADADRERTSVIVLLLVPAVTYSAVMMFASLRFAMFDRYWLYVAAFLIPCLFAIAGPHASLPRGRRQQWGGSAAWVAVGVLAAMAVTTTHDFMAASRARWQLLDQATQRDGIDPRRIDGGYEFNGPRLYSPNYVASRSRSWWWVADDEYVVAAGPLPGHVEVDRRRFDRWFLGECGQILLLRRLSR